VIIGIDIGSNNPIGKQLLKIITAMGAAFSWQSAAPVDSGA
jgi:hypothetical protein